MKKIKMPNIFHHKNIQCYLLEFLELNSAKHGFSQRYVSKMLEWPASYLPAMLKKKKKFSISRAIQFANCFKLNPLDMERMIYFAILDSEITSEDEIARMIALKTDKRMLPEEDYELLNAKSYLLFETIFWLKGKATLKVLNQLLVPHYMSPQEMNNLIKKLIKKNLIKNEDGKYMALKENISSDGHNPETAALVGKLHQDFHEIQKYYFNLIEGPATFNSGFICLDKATVKEIGDRLIAFRNWLNEVSSHSSAKTLEDGVRLFQFNLNITPVFKKEDVTSLMKS